MNSKSILNLIPMEINQREKIIREIKLKLSDGKKLFIYGAGTTAERMTRLLAEYEIMCSGYGVDSAYANSARGGDDRSMYDIDKVLENPDNVVLIGFENHTRAKEICKNCGENRAEIYYIEDPFRFRNMDYEFFLKNSEKYQAAYELLADDLSREIFVAHLKGRISGCSDELAKLRSTCGYEYEYDLLDLTDEEVFVDCGAFDGDTIREFAEHCLGKYSKIYAFEADKENAKKIRNNTATHCEIIEKAVGNEDGVTYFYDDNSLYSNVVESGLWGESTRRDLYGDQNSYIEVPITKLDTVLGDENVTFIKMDIEGSELEALKGAEHVIRRWHPQMAICVYHKAEDLFAITNYIHSISDGQYEYYLRHHSDNLTETVLYAKRRIKR